MLEKPDQGISRRDDAVTWQLLLTLAVSFGLSVLLTRYVDPYVRFLYGESGGMENTFFALIFLILALISIVGLLFRRARSARVTILLSLLGAALCLRFGQHGLIVWLLAEICFGAAMRNYQRRSLKSDTPL